MVKIFPCPVETTLYLISNRWVVLILRDLFMGTKRFGELKKSLDGISQKVLTANLRAMEDQGLITRTVYPEVPPRVEYSLTDLGASLRPIIASMYDWGMAYKHQNGEEDNDLILALGEALHQ
ncbi:MAG: helix-turn-helix transcriptional regulator [Clostridia bacterium]|nr:helix-turn-helix transcriptional regulator [Clostridia bacterium]